MNYVFTFLILVITNTYDRSVSFKENKLTAQTILQVKCVQEYLRLDI